MNNDFKIDDIPYDLVAIAKFMGVDMFIEFCDKFGGNHIYFPSKKSIFRNSRNREIKRSYNGNNIKELADKYDISQIHIKRIVNNK